MRRREFIRLVCGAALAFPTAARAQQAERIRRVGILMPFPPEQLEMQERVGAFREELRKLGWTSGRTVQFDERWTGDKMDVIRAAARDLVALNPDAILAAGGRVIPNLIELTHAIPIVVPTGTDPVARGYAESLAHPGHNVTGFVTTEFSVIGKMLQTLKEIAPQIERVSLLYNPDNSSGQLSAQIFESDAKQLGIEPIIARIHGLPDIERVVASAAAQPNGGIFVLGDVTLDAFVKQTVAVIAQHRVPAIYSERAFVANGGLLFYGTDRIELYRRSAVYVDRILRGEKAGDLPFQQPTKYNLAINLKTAKALGITVPPTLLLAADEVIE